MLDISHKMSYSITIGKATSCLEQKKGKPSRPREKAFLYHPIIIRRYIVIITKNDNFRNSVDLRIRPTANEGLYIHYLLKQNGLDFAKIASGLNVGRCLVLRVASGRRRSQKVETEIARILGKPSWNDLVIEARLFVNNPSFRPTQKDIDEYKDSLSLKLKEMAERKAKMREELAPMREAVKAMRRGR